MITLSASQQGITHRIVEAEHGTIELLGGIDAEINCGHPLIAGSFANQLCAITAQQKGLLLNAAPGNTGTSSSNNNIDAVAQKYPVRVVIDCPQGFALHELQKTSQEKVKVKAHRHSIPMQTSAKIVVVTFSTCTEYWEDLWDLQPEVLLVDPQKSSQLIDAAIRAHEGNSFRHLPLRSICLTSTERRALNCLALGGTNKQIAEQLSLQDQTVMNMLSTIYKKLNLKNRSEAINYYWGSSYTHYSQTSFPSK